MGKRKVVSDEEEEGSGSDVGVAAPLKKTKTAATPKKAPAKKPATKVRWNLDTTCLFRFRF